MPEEDDSRWMQLAAQASKEQDPVRLLQLVREINQLLRERADRTNLKLRSLPKAS